MIRCFLVAVGLVSYACSSQTSNAAPESAEGARSPAAPEERPPPAGADSDTPSVRVALTFDDLGNSPESIAPDVSRRILATLAQYDAPSAVFANCRELDTSVLDLWQEAGAEVGNHTATHPSIEELSRDDWRREVASCDKTLRAATGQDVRYFRYPFLRYGETEERRESAKAYLQELGYTVAHVSAATSEWLLAQYYDRALAIDDAELREDLVAAYVEHMAGTIEAARAMALDKVGRDIAHITLFHLNELAAQNLDQVLDEFERRGYELITLSEALADPVYQQPDRYAGGCGCSWLARIAPPLEPGNPYVFGQEQRALRERFRTRVEEAEREQQNTR